MKRSLLVVIAAILWASGASAQQAETRPYFYQRDISVTAVSYGYFTPVQGPTTGVGTVSTSGSSTTLTADATASTPFAPITVGSIISLQQNGATVTRIVTAKATDVSLTLNTAVTATALPWAYQTFTAGTGSMVGWLPALLSDYSAVEIDPITLAGSGTLNYRVECKLDSLATNSALLTSGSISTTGAFIIPLAENCNYVRVGFFWTVAATGTDSVSAYLNTKRFSR